MRRTLKTSLGWATVFLALTTTTGCAEGGAWGVIEELGRDDHSVSQPVEASEVEATIHRVVDGDTVTVKVSSSLPATNSAGSEHSVRVLGIDAPEMNWNSGNHECGAQAATDRVRQQIRAGDSVTLVYDEAADRFDRYNRSLAYVETADGTDVGETLLREGLVAAWYPASAPEPGRYADYVQIQTEAQTAERGSWGSCSGLGR